MQGSEFKISYSPKEASMISKLADQLYYEDLNEITGIEENVVLFKTMYIFELEDKIEVKVFIINSTEKNINFDELQLTIFNEDNEVVATEFINLSEVGEIPPKHVRPFSVLFSKRSILDGKSINEKCELKVLPDRTKANISNKTTIDYMDKKLSLYEKRIIEKYIEELPPLVESKFQIIPYKSGTDEDGNKYCILILSNGSDNFAEVDELSIIYKNAAGLIQACRKIHGFRTIKPKTTSVFKYIIRKEDILKEPFDPEKCTITLL